MLLHVMMKSLHEIKPKINNIFYIIKILYGYYQLRIYCFPEPVLKFPRVQLFLKNLLSSSKVQEIDR